jgi:hypothetical protein
MTRREILATAEKCVCGDREEDYGSPEDNLKTIAELWIPYIRRRCVSGGADVDITAEDVAALMILLKVARIASGIPKADNWIDIAGYAACGGEIECAT